MQSGGHLGTGRPHEPDPALHGNSQANLSQFCADPETTTELRRYIKARPPKRSVNQQIRIDEFPPRFSELEAGGRHTATRALQLRFRGQATPDSDPHPTTKGYWQVRKMIRNILQKLYLKTTRTASPVSMRTTEAAIATKNTGYCHCCRTNSTFQANNDWLRDHYICLKCHSIPRQRHIQLILDKYFPG